MLSPGIRVGVEKTKVLALAGPSPSLADVVIARCVTRAVYAPRQQMAQAAVAAHGHLQGNAAGRQVDRPRHGSIPGDKLP